MNLEIVLNKIVSLENSDGTLSFNDSIDSIYIDGNWSDEVSDILASLVRICGDVFNDFGLINLDEELVLFEDLELELRKVHSEWSLTIQKDELLKSTDKYSGEDIKTYLFSSAEWFKKNASALGFETPLVQSRISSSDQPKKIIIHQLQGYFAGPRLFLTSSSCEMKPECWIGNTRLPSRGDISKRIHILSSESLSVSPRNFEVLEDKGSEDISLLLRNAFAIHLLASLSHYLFSSSRIMLKGIKHVELDLALGEGADFDWGRLDLLIEIVNWCYEREDYGTRNQLVVDRLSLETEFKTNIFHISFSVYKNAFEQAKSKYSYVVSERSEEYRKELTDIHSNTLSLIERYIDKSSDITNGLVRDVLSLIFIFTIFLFTRAMSNEDILQTRMAGYLFNFAGIYIIATYLLRRLQAGLVLSGGESNLFDWISDQYSHISVDKAKEKVEKALIKPKRNFQIMSGIVLSIHIILAIYILNIQKFLN